MVLVRGQLRRLRGQQGGPARRGGCSAAPGDLPQAHPGLTLTGRRDVLAAAALLAGLAACSSATGGGPPIQTFLPPGETTSTAPPTGTPLACHPTGGTAATSGAGTAAAGAGAGAVELYAQVQHGACDDVFVLSFQGAAPAWTASYQSGPLAVVGSGQAVGGAAHLIVRLAAARTADGQSVTAAPLNGVPRALSPPRPADILQIRLVDDASGALTWAAGFARPVPYVVTTKGNLLVVRFQVPRARATNCALGEVTVIYPPSWYADSAGDWACQAFGPAPFAIAPQPRVSPGAISAQKSAEPFRSVLLRYTSDRALQVTANETTQVLGRPAHRLQVRVVGQSLLGAPGELATVYIATLAKGSLVMSTHGPAGTTYEALQRVLDRMVEQVHF